MGGKEKGKERRQRGWGRREGVEGGEEEGGEVWKEREERGRGGGGRRREAEGKWEVKYHRILIQKEQPVPRLQPLNWSGGLQ